MGFISKQVDDFLGKGITLPLRLVNGAVPIDSGADLVKASIKFLLSWTFGTRFFLPEYGSRFEELLEEPNDDVLLHLAYTMTKDAIETWEKRVELVDLQTVRDDLGRLSLRIFYRIITSQKTEELVFPFYTEITT